MATTGDPTGAASTARPGSPRASGEPPEPSEPHARGAAALTPPRTGFVLVAAGSGTRLGAGMPKAFVEVAGRTLLEHGLRALEGFPGRVAIAVAAPASHLDEARRIARDVAAADVRLVPGGASRQASVAAALTALPNDCDVVLVHDVARAFAPRALAERVAGAVRATGEGVVPVLPVTDTIKRVEGDRVLETVDRATLGAAQTPQGFPGHVLRRAHAAADRDYTDDAALAAAAGLAVRTVPGDPLAFKVTHPGDLDRARRADSGNDPGALAAHGASGALAAHGASGALVDPGASDLAVPADVRIGIGIDAHAFADEAELHLAGLQWPGERGLSGHSDGDAVAHAVCDALLSAAGLGDLGGMFGTDDPALEGARGEVFLRRTRERLEGAGMRIRNVAVQFVAQRPRFAPRREEACAALEAVLGCPVSVTATTSDGLGFTGRREGLVAVATALVAHPPA